MEKQTITYISVDRLNPHPDNPRKDLGDLTELAESIKTNGVMQNLTVIPGHYITLDEFIKMSKAEGVTKDVAKGMYDKENSFVGDDYTVIIGHRRMAAAQLAGLTELPCIITEMDEKTQLTTMLAENMQRADLTVYEQAQGFQMMIDLGATVEEVAEKSGFSQSTVRRRLKIAELDPKILKKVSSDEGRQLSLGDFDKLAEIEDLKLRNTVLKDIGTNNFAQAIASAKKKQKIAEKLPKLKEWLKAHNAIGLDDVAARSSRYICSVGKSRIYCGYIPIDTFGEKTGRAIPKDKDIEGVQIYYTLHDDHFSLYVEDPNGSSGRGKKTESEKARDRVMREVRAEIKELSKMHYTMRKAFIDDLTVTKTNRDKIVAGALAPALYFAHCGGSEAKSKTVGKVIQVREYEYHTDNLIKGVTGVKEKDLAQAVYSLYDDSEEMWFAKGMQTPSTIPSYDAKSSNIKLTLLYLWLQTLGYQMSDEEKELMDGSHEVYHRGYKKEKS